MQNKELYLLRPEKQCIARADLRGDGFGCC